MSKSAMYLKFLRKEGFSAEFRDGAVVFDHEGGKYVICPDEKDAQYFRLVYPNFYKIGSPDERSRVLATASAVTASLKGVKVFELAEDTCAAIELFLPRPEDFKEIFRRSLGVLAEAAKLFRLQMTFSEALADKGHDRPEVPDTFPRWRDN